MSSTGLLKAVSVLVGALIAGEALALMVGMHVLNTDPHPWISLKNDALAISDVIIGLGLIGIGWMAGSASAIPFCSLSALAALTHLYRGGEYLVGIRSAFCFNAPLFVVNNVKLVGALVILSVVLLMHSR